jgi:hypothetical protein
MAKKLGQITIEVKDPDGWGEVIHDLGLSDAKARKYFEFGEYATLQLEVEEDMTVTGRIVPRGRR